MNKKTVLALLAASLCACAPVRKDPFAGFDVSKVDPGLKAMKAALVLSENTKGAVAYLSGPNAQSLFGNVRFDSDRYFDKLTMLLRNRFRDVVKIGSPQDAAAVGADIVVVLDVYAKVAAVSGMNNEFHVKMIFLAPNGSQIDQAEGVGQARVPFPAFSRTEAAATQSIAKLDAAVDASQKLKEFARTHAPAAGAFAAAPMAPVKRAPVSDVDAPRYAAAEPLDNAFAVIVGVEHYENLPAAEFAERDAAAVKAHLLALGYAERNVIHLTGGKAAKSAIEKYVETWLPRNVNSGSTVFFYFSGHGAPDPVSGRAYLVPWDGDAKYLENTGYPLSRLYQKLNALKARRVLVAMDSCFSGAGGRSVLAYGTRPLVTKVDAGIDAGRLVILAASAGDEISGVSAEQGHGLFTYHLLKGLSKEAGRASAQSLFGYLSPLVQDAARRDNRDQTPQFLPGSDPAAATARWAE